MDTLLTVAVAVIALAIVVQTGILVAMYLLSRKLADDVKGLVEDGRRIAAPLESVAANLKAASYDLTEVAQSARAQLGRVENMLTDTREAVSSEIDGLRFRFSNTVDKARQTALRPVRECAAIARGIAAGVRTLLYGKDDEEDRSRPAA